MSWPALSPVGWVLDVKLRSSSGQLLSSAMGAKCEGIEQSDKSVTSARACVPSIGLHVWSADQM